MSTKSIVKEEKMRLLVLIILLSATTIPVTAIIVATIKMFRFYYKYENKKTKDIDGMIRKLREENRKCFNWEDRYSNNLRNHRRIVRSRLNEIKGRFKD